MTPESGTANIFEKIDTIENILKLQASIGFTTNSLDRVMNGKLDDIIEALITEDQARKLRGEQFFFF